MSCISGIFNRLDIQYIRGFLVSGTECPDFSDKTYKERIDEAENELFEKIKNKIPVVEDYDEIVDNIGNYAYEIQNVYMEIGMQCGAKLAAQLLTSPLKN